MTCAFYPPCRLDALGGSEEQIQTERWTARTVFGTTARGACGQRSQRDGKAVALTALAKRVRQLALGSQAERAAAWQRRHEGLKPVGLRQAMFVPDSALARKPDPAARLGDVQLLPSPAYASPRPHRASSLALFRFSVRGYLFASRRRRSGISPSAQAKGEKHRPAHPRRLFQKRNER